MATNAGMTTQEFKKVVKAKHPKTKRLYAEMVVFQPMFELLT